MDIMALPKKIQVKESSKEIKKLQKGKPVTIIKRLNMLLELKKHEGAGVSKRDLAKIVGVDPNSVQSWRALYIKGGITSLIKHNKTGFKPSIIKPKEHKLIEKQLKNPNNGLRGYKELMHWIKTDLNVEVKYTTLFEYVKRNFGAKIKVARKSHVRKNKEAVETFKKTSVKSFKK